MTAAGDDAFGPAVASYVVVSGRPAACVAFYRAVGMPLADEEHDDGPVHWAAELGGVHVAVYAGDSGDALGRALGHRQPGSTFVGWWVADLEATADRVRALGGPVGDHEQRGWGCRVVAEDPDGRPVEINQRGHCPRPGTAPDR